MKCHFFYSVPDCICLSEWHRPSWNSPEASPGADINFTQMCPPWAWVHDWMNAHSHTYSGKTSVRALAPDFIIAATLLPLPLCWQPIWEWNVTFPLLLAWRTQVCVWLYVCTSHAQAPQAHTQFACLALAPLWVKSGKHVKCDSDFTSCSVIGVLLWRFFFSWYTCVLCPSEFSKTNTNGSSLYFMFTGEKKKKSVFRLTFWEMQKCGFLFGIREHFLICEDAAV